MSSASTTAVGATGASATVAPHYFVPEPSRHPAMAAFGLFWVILGAGQWVNGADWGKYALAFGMVWWLVVHGEPLDTRYFLLLFRSLTCEYCIN